MRTPGFVVDKTSGKFGEAQRSQKSAKHFSGKQAEEAAPLPISPNILPFSTLSCYNIAMQPEQPKDEWQQPTQPPQTDAPIVEVQPDLEAEQQEAVVEAELEVSDEPVEQVESADEMPIDAEIESTPEGEEELVRWEAIEHIHREKAPLWYVGFAVVVVLLMVAAFFLMRSWTFAVLVPVMAAALFLYVQRPPAMNQYTLSRKGLHVNDKLHTFDSFKEFGLIADDDEHSIMLIPRKRFHMGVTIYFPEEAGEAIVDMLAARLPMKEVRLDPIEKLIRALHI